MPPKGLGTLLGDAFVKEDGMALFIALTPNNSSNPETINQMKSYLNSCVSIDAHFVSRSESRGSELITDLENWRKALNALFPIISQSNIEINHHKRNLPGAEIASDLLSLFYKSETEASDGFKNYLRNKTGRIKDGIRSKGAFKMIVAVMSVEISGSESEQRHAAKIKLFRANLDSRHAQWIDGCSNPATIDFEIINAFTTHEFNFDQLSNISLKKTIDKFLDQTRKADIINNENYYEGSY